MKLLSHQTENINKETETVKKKKKKKKGRNFGIKKYLNKKFTRGSQQQI